MEKAFFEKEFWIGIDDVDLKTNLKLSKLQVILQEIAGIHSTVLGYGYYTTIAQNISWIIAKTRVEIAELPRLWESVLVKTWVVSSSMCEVVREYEIYNAHGKRLVGATARWVLIDLARRRPTRLSSVEHVEYEFVEGFATEQRYAVYKPEFDGKVLFTHYVNTSDLDFNGHLNNTKYIDIALNALSLDEYTALCPKAMQISFTSECSFGDKLNIELIKNEDGALNFKGVIDGGKTAYLFDVEF